MESKFITEARHSEALNDAMYLNGPDMSQAAFDAVLDTYLLNTGLTLMKAPQDMNLRELFDHVAIVADAVRAALLTHPGMTPVAPTEYFHIQQFKIWKGVDPDKPMWADLNLVFRDRRAAQDTLDYLARNKPEYPFRIEARRAGT